MYAVIVESKEVRSNSPGHPVFTQAGEKFVVVKGEFGLTGDHYDGKIPLHVMTFETSADAKAFAKPWKGHPWWCKPRKYEVIEIEPVYERVSGYKVKHV